MIMPLAGVPYECAAGHENVMFNFRLLASSLSHLDCIPCSQVKGSGDELVICAY